MIKNALEMKSRDCDPEKRSLCTLTDCTLHDFCTKKIARKSMIRKFCLTDCMNGLRKEVQLCPSAVCPFYPYRMGNNTKRGQL